MRWLEGPAPHGAGFGINRYLYRVYNERADLAVAYPFLDGPDGSGFAGWVWVFGVVEMEIPERFLPPPPPGLERAAPGSGRHRRPLAPLPRGRRPDLSVHVSGLFGGTLGLGEAARGYVRALEQVAIPVSTSTVDVREFVKLAADPHEDYAQRRLHRRRRSRVERVPAHLPQRRRAAPVRGDGGRGLLRGTAGDRRLGLGDGSGAGALERALSSCWTRSGSTPTTSPRTSPAARLDTGAPRAAARVARRSPATCSSTSACPDGFRFMFMFDFFSTIQRKNPVGLVEAFRLAFAPGEGPQLVIKTINGVHRPHALERAAVGGARPAGHPRRRPFAERARARRAGRRVRLLRVAAPQRGLRPHARGVHGARQAGDRHRPSPARPTS